jgi:oxygen-dependent protoporphyrinogen oxidase
VTLRVGAPPERQAVEHAAVVVATPAAGAAALLEGATWLSDLRTRSTATLVLGLDRRLDTGWFGLTIPRREPPGAELAAVCVQSAKATALGEEGDALVLIPAPPVAEAWAGLDVDGVAARAYPALERVLPGVADRVVARRLVPLPDAITVPGPGHYARIRSLDRDALPRRVALAGDYLGAPTVEGAVRSGLAAADEVVDRLRG